MLGRDDHIARGCEGEAKTGSNAVHARHDGLARTNDGSHAELSVAQELADLPFTFRGLLAECIACASPPAMNARPILVKTITCTSARFVASPSFPTCHGHAKPADSVVGTFFGGIDSGLASA